MRKICLFLCLVMLLQLPCITHAEEKQFSMMGLELSDSGRIWSENNFFAVMEEKTGISFSYTQYTDREVYHTALSALAASDNLPDVLFKADLTQSEERNLAEAGVLINLAPLLEENAPTLFQILQARSDWAAIITQPDGVIASLPSLNGADRECFFWINQAWLDTLGLSMPQNIDEFTSVLTAFRDEDPNGNYKKDEIPLSLCGVWEARFLLHAFGLTPNDYSIYVDESNTVQYAPYQAQYRSFVQWLHDALTNGLIDPNAFRQPQAARSSEITGKNEEDPNYIGCLVTYAPFSLVTTDDSSDFSAMPPLEYEGTRAYRKLLTGVTRGTFAITSACEDPAALLQWADYLYTEEGGRLLNAGREGIDYAVNADGTWKWLTDGDDYYSLSTISQYSVLGGDDRTPGLEPVAFMRQSEVDYDTHVRRQTDSIRKYFVQSYPSLWPADDAAEARIDELQNVLAPLVDTAIAEFAMGIRELNDETWSAFMEDLRLNGADELTALFQQKLDNAQ